MALNVGLFQNTDYGTRAPQIRRNAQQYRRNAMGEQQERIVLSDLVDKKRQQDLLNKAYEESVMPDGSINEAKMTEVLYQGDGRAQLPGVKSGFDAQREEKRKAGRVREEEKRADYGKKLEIVAGRMSRIVDKPDLSYNDVNNEVQGLFAAGALDEEDAQAALSGMPKDPKQLRSYLRNITMEALKEKDRWDAMNPKIDPGVTAKYTADSAAATTRRGQDITAATARRGQDIDRTKVKEPSLADLRAMKKDAMAEQREARNADFMKKKLDIVIGKIDDAIADTTPLTTGIPGRVRASIPGNRAYNLSKTLDTIKANIGFNELQAMRDASPTGGALGQVAVQELNALQSTLASLDQFQDDKQLAKNLDLIKTHYNNWKDTLGQAAMNEQAPSPPKKGATGSPPEGATGISKSGKPVIFRGGQWELNQ